MRWYNAISVFHHNDIVEEIATLRQGDEIDTVDQYISEGQKMPPHRWRVRFLEGREPLFSVFRKGRRFAVDQSPHSPSASSK